jgi:MoaA/NifB/PqqE/SkfB family radical SAM enzyme
MGPTGDHVNIIQIHPTLRCNLRCRHCYSSSGPERTLELPVEQIEAFITDAAAEGFNAVAISGGEPLTYRALPRLLEAARRRCYFTAVTSNGLLLDARRLAAIAPNLSLLAISLDGTPESHDQIRGLPQAFNKMRSKLDDVRRTGIPFGFIFTLTLGNLHELSWIAEFACAEGAGLLQVHPLESVGQALESGLLPPDDLELSYAFLEVARLQAIYDGRLKMQFDVADRALIEREPQRAFVGPPLKIAEASPLASLISPLVLQDDGWVVPIQYGFSTDYAIAHLGRGSFQKQAARWKQVGVAQFRQLSQRVWENLRSAPKHLAFTNWYAAITAASKTANSPGKQIMAMSA